MSFTSIHFALFFPIVVAVYWSLRRSTTARLTFLLAASYYFYMSWNVAYAALILGSTILDFLVAQRMHAASGSRRRRWLLTSLIGNLGVLFVFKYYNFFADSLAQTFSFLGVNVGATGHSMLLPVGISFYTFQTMSYAIDVYRGDMKPTKSFLRFALFVSFFPQLVAGPIVRASHFLPQLVNQPRFNDARAEKGLAQIMLGLFKKLCIADLIGITIVDRVYGDPSAYGSSTLVIASYAYAFQAYFDFSGYSDIAIGAARMLGFDLPLNFDRPLLATSVRNFWRRWHISLSSWLRDYLYVPLGGGHGGALKTTRNLAIVMILCGLWHGAAWGFIIFGFLQFMFLAIGRAVYHVTGVEADRTDQPFASRVLRVVATFTQFSVSLIFFRTGNLSSARNYLAALTTGNPVSESLDPLAYIVLALAVLTVITPRDWAYRLASNYFRLPSAAQACILTSCLLFFTVLGANETPFIYFQF